MWNLYFWNILQNISSKISVKWSQMTNLIAPGAILISRFHICQFTMDSLNEQDIIETIFKSDMIMYNHKIFQLYSHRISWKL